MPNSRQVDNEEEGYADLFSDSHNNAEPEIQADGTSIKWPKSWSPKDANLWRKFHGLEKPRKPKKKPAP